MTIPLWAYHTVLGLLILLAVVLLWKINRSGHPWRFADMLTTHKDGKPVADRQAFVLLGAFFTSSAWGTMLALEGKLSEWFFTTYMLAWAGSHFGSRWLRIQEDKEKK